MPDATLLLRIVDGAREPLEGETLVTLVDGAQRIVHRATHRKPTVRFTIPVTNGPIDTYRVVVSADGRLDAGQTGVKLTADTTSEVDVMMLPRRGFFRFQPLAAVAGIHPRLHALIVQFLDERFGSHDDAAYQRLQQENPGGLATLLSISSGFAGFGQGVAGSGSVGIADDAIRSHPLQFIGKLQRLEPDRFFAEAAIDMLEWLSSSTRTFSHAPNALHRGSFVSFKELRYLEGNVQFTFSRTDNAATVVVDSDIDLFADTASHLLLEVLPNDGLHVIGGTDPRQAYAFRWMSVQRAKAATGLDFSPPFSVVMG